MSRTTVPQRAVGGASHRLVTTIVAAAGFVALAGAAVWMYPDTPAASTDVTPVVAQQPAPQPAAQPAPAPAVAAQTPAPTPAPAPTAAPATGVPAGTAAQQAFIDPKTGQLRPVEHDDAAALAGAGATTQRKAARSLAQPQEMFGPEGAVGVNVPEDLLTFTVATRQPDGTVTVGHVTGAKAAEKQVKNPQAKKGAGHPDKEERNDR